MIMKRKNIILSTFLSICLLLLSSCTGNTEALTSVATDVSYTEVITTEQISSEVTVKTTSESAVQDTTIQSTEAETTTTVVETTTTTSDTSAETETTTTSIEATTATEAETEQLTTTVVETDAETEETTVLTTDETIEKKYIALTFDDGPNTTTTNDVLDVLEKYNIVASFFLVGNNINSETEASVKRAYDMGCEIGNHSKTHSNMIEFSAEEITSEIDYVDDYVEKITGEKPKFFRPPYISVNDRMLETIEMPFIAGFGANDWEDRIPATKRTEMILRQAKNGGIILLHDMQGNDKTVEALDTIIPELKAQGYEFVTVSGLFEALGVTPKAHDRKIYTYADQQYMYG